ncbi:MAG UNVERIFIED_CONTAM: hypothetical protein LVT10_20580 [Anaerolineae bacterium]|jgi:hypothetical protein
MPNAKLPTVFKLTPLVFPSDLDEHLSATRQYAERHGARVSAWTQGRSLPIPSLSKG